MISLRLNSSSLTRSFQFFALMFRRSTVSQLNTLPVFRSATICVLSVNTLNVTGSTYSSSSFFRKLSLINSELLRGCPSTGFVPCFLIHGKMFVRSNIVPCAVQTGCSKGCNETAQKLNGRRLKLAPTLVAFRALAPAAAPNASSEDHSLWVICIVLVCSWSGQGELRGDARTAYRCLQTC